ncbi:uncharacterized protein LOC130448658 [Diorhabda sublineata]|uniref:uncharacterized protein LOC130448658 n=1 Tax=Diorhabda sublineata TaxID=1163346 RepID=UPI0024E122DF|nr:uncharacterized protein LOC130448658 [Diorhabda sublineata]
MLINLVKTVACFYLCLSITTSDAYYKTSDRTFLKKPPPSNNRDNYNKQSRYTKFDKVMSRINKLNYDEDQPDDGVYRIRHKGWTGKKIFSTTPSTTTEMDLFETYGEMENEDEFDDYDTNLDDDDDELDYDDDDDDSKEEHEFFYSLDEDIQAEEASTSPPKTFSKLTEYKWNHFGTKEKVEESMRKQLNLNPSREQLNVNAVIEHYKRVNQQSKCSTPLPRVISVQQEHPNPSKSYIPACTVLHRCADDSGCCKRHTRCQYKTRTLVSLYFYAKVIGNDHSTVERLDFYNHTECECKETEDIPYKIDSGKSFDLETQQDIDNNTSCSCPKPYKPVIKSHKCACDCDENDEDCITLKRGNEHFSMTNRICIQDNLCGMPSCEYGAYMISEGKCPTKQDKLEEFRKIRIHK